MYKQLGIPHTESDPDASWDEVREVQDQMKNHLRACNIIFNAGEETNQDRVLSAKELGSSTIPVLSLMVKDHKAVDTNGNPKTRPVCGASSAINGKISEYLADILDAVCQADESDEVISSEELLSQMDDLNEALEKRTYLRVFVWDI